MKLLLNALVKFLAGMGLCAALLFWPAGTWRYPGAWAFLALLFVPMLGLGVWLFVKQPDLLRKRLETREKEKAQKAVVGLSGLIFLSGFVLSALDFRLGWTHVPLWLRVVGAAVQLIAYGLYAEVMRRNAYLSRTVRVQAGQRVISTGLYGVVRHPMYMATVFLFLSIPLVLGSWVGLAVFAPFPAVLALRIHNEEKVLLEQLEGYAEYMRKVKYRLVPWVW